MFRLLLVPAVLLGFSICGFAQAEKYTNITDFPDAQILSYLQKSYPNDKLNYYDVKLNGRMQHVKNYYDYISFRCVLLDSQVVKSVAAKSNDGSRATNPESGASDTALMRRVLEDTTGKLRDSIYQVRETDSLKKVSIDSLAKATAAKTDTTLGLQANTTNQLANVLGASNDISLSKDNVLSKRQVDSTWVLADTLISARRGVTHPTENSVPTSAKSEPLPVAASYVVTADTIYMINCGANAEHRPSLIWIYHSKDPSTHIVVGSGDFKEEMLMLQSFCDGLGAKLTPFQVEIWDLFVKSHQSAMYTPVYDHEARYKSAAPVGPDAALPPAQ